MIASNELRKGNYVLHNEKHCSVTQLFWDGLEICFQNGQKPEYITCKYEEVNPIDLTVEILEKCDLVKHERFHYSNVFLSQQTNFTINQLRDNMEISFGVSSTPAIIAKGNLSLHQLQNLYFALHQEELGITI
jgi:hypothetical protein